jgi:nucleoside-diphosphate-sugar epimerase
MKIFITGESGFVGGRLFSRLVGDGFDVVGLKGSFRNLIKKNGFIENEKLLIELGRTECLVHLAARVHVMNDTSSDPLTEFRRVNVDGTANLARQAAASGVRRFVFLSSIKVNGEFTVAGQSFTADDEPAPKDAYGISKHEAEQLLRQIADETGMEVVIIRSPLVYGPGVKANFAAMMRWLDRGLPLPLAAVTQNRRSLVALDNLVDLIVTCLHHPAAAHQTFLVSDGEGLSTADLLQRMGGAMGRAARLFYVPTAFLKLAAHLVNKPGIYQRLCGSLQLDITKTRQVLGWAPPVSVNEGLRRAAEGLDR